MAINTEILREIGFSNNEIKVYMALLRIGSASATEITRKSGIHRANVYDSLEKLMERGLVSNIVRMNKKYFECAHPRNIVAIIKERERDLEGIMPELDTIYNQRKEKQKISHFEGREGIKAVLRDINNYKSHDAFGVSSNLAKIMGYYFTQWIRERLEKGLTARMIKSHGDRLATPKKFGLRNYRKLFRVKEVQKEFHMKTSTWVYENKTAIILESVDNPVAVVIENKEIADDYRKQFEIIWKRAKDEDTSIYK